MSDTPKDHNSLYDASYWEIFWKNFLVGFARGLGGFVVYIVFLLIAYYSFISVVLPKLQPFLTAFIKAQETVSKIQNPQSVFENLFKQENGKPIELDTPRQTR